jgi:hypothetical protein
MGINRRAHIKLESASKWHALGDILAPKEHWNTLLSEDPGERRIGLLSLTMERNPRPDGLLGYMRVKVEPSLSVQYGVFIEVNDHFEIPTKHPPGCEEILEILSKQFSISVPRSEEIIDSLIEMVR